MRTVILVVLAILALPTAYQVADCTVHAASWDAWKACVGARYSALVEGPTTCNKGARRWAPGQ